MAKVLRIVIGIIGFVALPQMAHAVDISRPASHVRLNMSLQPSLIQKVCVANQRTCKTSKDCCSGTCAERGSKGWVCI